MSWKNEFWETMCPLADVEVGKIMGRLVEGKIRLSKAFTQLERVPYDFPDCDMCKETTNKFIEHAVEQTGSEEDEVVEVYNKVREIAFQNWKKNNPDL
jgi:hypothetical protein